MRILEVTTFYKPVGGAEIYMHQVAAGLGERGHEVAIFAGSPDESIDEQRVRVVQRPDFHAGNLVRDNELQDALRSFMASFKPDVIHLHNTYSFPAEFSRVLAEQGVPIVMTIHDWSLLCPNGWCVVPPSETEKFRVCEGGPGPKCFERGCQANYPFDARVVLAAVMRLRAIRDTVTSFTAPSAFLAEMAEGHDLQPSLALPLWIEPESFGGQEVFDAALAEVVREPHRMLFVGRLAAEKGLNFLVDAMPEILRSLPDAKLSLVGDGPVASELAEQVARLGLQESVVLHGKVPHEEVIRFMARASAQVLPSVWCENSPLTCYESLLSGLPMVASDIAGLPSMVRPGETGMLAKPRDPADLAKKLVELLGNRDVFEKLSAGCLRDVGRYSKNKHLDSLERVFAEAVELGARNAEGDGDLADSIHRVLEKAKLVEDWANGMHGHIEQLNRQQEHLLPKARSAIKHFFGKD